MVLMNRRSVLDGSNVLEVVGNLTAIGDIVCDVDEILEVVTVLIAATIQEIEHGYSVFILGFVEGE